MAGYLDPNDPVVQAFAKLGTTPVSDAMDRLGLIGQCFGIKPVDREFTLCGRAHTVRNEPMTAGQISEILNERWAMSAYPRNLSPHIIDRLLENSANYCIVPVEDPEEGEA